MPSNGFKIKNLKAVDYKQAEIIDVSIKRSYGRRFKIKLADDSLSKEYRLNDIFKKVKKLSKVDSDPFKKNEDLNSLKNFLGDLKTADLVAEDAYKKRDAWYRFRTWFHRIFSFGKHSDRIDDLNTKIQNKIDENQIELDDAIQLSNNAAKAGDIEAIKQMVSANTNFNVISPGGATPLGWAAHEGHSEIVQILIEAGAEIDMVVTIQGVTPLQIAVMNGHFETTKMLLGLNADCNHINNSGFSVLMTASNRKKKEIVELLLKQQEIQVNFQDKNGVTALMCAIGQGDKAIVELLLNHQEIQVNLQDKDGFTALMWAIMHGENEIVELLLDRPDIQINLQDTTGFTAFVFSKSLGNDELKNLLSRSLTPTDLLIQKEVLKIRLLAHSVSKGGTSQIQLENSELSFSPIGLEGIDKKYLLKKLSSNTKKFSEFYSGKIEENEASQFVELLETGVETSNEKIIERIGKGLSVLIPTGFKGHGVEVLVWGSYFILCNRGGGRRKVVEVFKHNPDKLTDEILNKIRNVSKQDVGAYKKLFFEELPTALDFKPQGPFEKELENHFKYSLNAQTVGNCAWASSEAAIYGFFALNTILPGSNGQLNLDNIPSAISRLQKRDIDNKFYTWLCFTQAYQLERYLGVHVIRSSENDKVEQRAERRKVVKIDYSVLLASLQAIKSTAIDTTNPEETLNILRTLLAKALALKNAGDEEQHLRTAQEILDALRTLNPDKLKSKFEQVI